MEYFIGTYECKLDAKGRLMLPVSLKKQLSKTMNEGFIIKRSVFNTCLELYPNSQWNLKMQEINQLNRFNKKNIEFIRCFTSGVKMVEIDATGRLLIPKDLIRHSNLEKEIVIASAVTILEIWDKTSYEKSVNKTADNFEVLAEEIMGNKNEIS